jgi:putative serine protease PepD
MRERVAARDEHQGGPRHGRARAAAAGLAVAGALVACSGVDAGAVSERTATSGVPTPSASPSGQAGRRTPGTPSTSAVAPAPSPGREPAVAAGSLEADYRRVIKAVLPSVVEIRTAQGLGSGVVYDAAGDIVTNAHVVGSATRFEVFLPGRADPVTATLRGTYPPDDLAVIRLADPSGARPATFGRSADLQVGDIVLAMGNPLGLESSVTNGIVSALGRTVSEPQSEGSPGATIPDAIQTSAAINPGNSGGALVDLDAQVVGIPTLAAVSPEGGGAAPGIGFAISSDTVRRIAPQLASSGRVTDSGRAALGVAVTPVTDQQGESAGLGVVEVTRGGPADKAGIRTGDVLVSVAGQATPTQQALAAVLAGQKVGATIPVQVTRDDSTSTIQVTLGELAAG